MDAGDNVGLHSKGLEAQHIRGKEEPKNDKLKVTPKEVVSILVAAAATALCVIIDVLLKEGNENGE